MVEPQGIQYEQPGDTTTIEYICKKCEKIQTFVLDDIVIFAWASILTMRISLFETLHRSISSEIRIDTSRYNFKEVAYNFWALASNCQMYEIKERTLSLVGILNLHNFDRCCEMSCLV